MVHTTGEVVLASGNPGKLREFQALLADSGFTVRPQSELGVSEAAETGLTFIENALLKARHAARHTGLPAIADDSGLAVDALQGRPGIYSARFAGPAADDTANNAALLDALAGVPLAQRTARYHCVLVYLRHAEDPVPLICERCWEGYIATAPRGSGGFGYDPLFWLPDLDVMAAELEPERKNRISHRGQALQALLAALTGPDARA